ncbi:hypothetical protein [Psychrobacter sp.]|uniref:hypothetical protein n=1 Tax=Psychrobacter sp. TaxID=56811 RepID=UPI003C749632
MSTKTFTGINAIVIHPQWFVPMGFHKIARAEHDLVSNKSYIIFASYYNQVAAENGSEAMTHNTVILDSAVLADEPTLLQIVIDAPDNVMTGGAIVSGEINVDSEDM